VTKAIYQPAGALQCGICIGQTGGHDFVRQNSSAYCRSVFRVLEGSTFKAPWACDLGATVRIRYVCDGSG
jgi:hypothetical protein